MANRAPKRLCCCGVMAAFLFPGQILAAQTRTGQDNNRASPIACSLATNRQEWNPDNTAIVNVTVESLSDDPLEVPLWSGLLLAPISPGDSFAARVPGRIVAALRADVITASLPSRTVIRDVKGEGAIRLRFQHKGDQANLKFDARDLIWDYEVVSRTPALRLFSLAKPGKYSLQFQMTWTNGSCNTAAVPITITKPGQK